MKSVSDAVSVNLPVSSLSDWEKTMKDRVPLYGHRNWVVVADSAYPAQARGGIETIVTGADQPAVLERVVATLRASRHVKPAVYTDQELKFVAEQDAPGISAYRDRLANLLEGFTSKALPHEEIISRLDRAGQTFRVLVIKTNLTIPYTSVFFELDCAYWNTAAENRLRLAMRNLNRKRRPKGARKVR